MAEPHSDLLLTMFKLFMSTLGRLLIKKTPPPFFESKVKPLPLITRSFEIVTVMSPSIDLSRV